MSKAPETQTGAGGKTRAGSSKGSLAHLTCTRCDATVTPIVTPSGPHLRADCPLCGRYLCFVPKRSPWRELLETPPNVPVPLFAGEQ